MLRLAGKAASRRRPVNSALGVTPVVDRLTVDELFEALHAQRIYPLIDSPAARKVVQAVARAYGAEYRIKDRWPVLDLESAYEGHLNAHTDTVEFHRNGYDGTIRLQGFDDRYTMDEWFDDFRSQWSLIDTSDTRRSMLSHLPPGDMWKSAQLYEAHESAVRGTLRGLARRLFKPR